MNAPEILDIPVPFYQPQGAECELFEAAWRQQLPVLIKGPTGCGKTRFVAHMAARLGLPLITVSCHDDLSAADLVGRHLIADGATVWCDGPLTRAVRIGGICYLDEVVEARKDTTVVLHPLTDDRRILPVERTGEVLQAPPGFMLVVSYNPGYQHVLKTLKPSTRQRFVAMSFDFPPPEVEIGVLTRESGVSEALARQLVTLAGQLRRLSGYDLEEAASTRLLVYAAKLVQAGLPPWQACRTALAEPLSDDADTVAALLAVIQTQFPRLSGMEDIVGGWWDKLARRAARRGFPEYAAELAQVTAQAPLFFRAMGGDPALALRSTVGTEHGARRGWLQRLAGTGARMELAWQDSQALYLPERIDCFPSAALNRDCYFWLLAQAAYAADSDGDWLSRNRLAAARALAAMPGLAALYRRLAAAVLEQRPDPAGLPPAEAEVERAIQAALSRPEQAATLPPLSRPPQPVPLWLHPEPPLTDAGGQGDRHADGERGGGKDAQRQRRRYRARRMEQDQRKNGMLMVFRAESLFTWDEYVKVNRHNDDDDDGNGEIAAEDMNRLTLGQDAHTRGDRLRFDLDLPAAAYDDTPLGPGIKLPEWHWKRQCLVEDHCLLRPMLPRDAAPAPLPERLQPLARRLRRQFQALAPERRRRSGETAGPDIDLDRLIRFLAERRGGAAFSEPALYQDWPPGERSLACLTLADLSLSTESWLGETGRVIDVIRDSLLLFAEALAASGDDFGLYGFSSLRRQEVRLQILKDFADRYDDDARGRILAIRPGYYTRMGAAIRQCTRILSERPAQRRLLLLISDGKPNDLDHYEGRYGIEDTRQAVLEARRAGLTPFCVTIDREAGDYLPHLFGRNGYALVRQAERLPQALTRLYASLTA